MAKRTSSLFSPTRHHALRRRSVPAGGSGGSSAMSPSSSAPWSRKEAALLVQAWRDVAEHPCAALESVDAFQTRLFLRFQEVCGIGKDNDDDTVSMAGSECSMESVDTAGDAYYARAARTQTSVVLKTYALRRMAGFITDFITKQESLKQKIADKQVRVEMEVSQEREEVEMIEPDAETEEENTPVDWFALTKNDQIERFQRAGASNYIELDEHMYNTIGTILELQDKCKQEAVTHGSASNGNSSNRSNANAAANTQNSWSAEEVRHVLDAWRDSHLRTPTKLPGGDSFYARFIARSGHNSQRSKPEVADTKIALMNMHQVIATFNNRTPTNGKLTRGNLKRQRQNWFTLSATEKAKAFAEGGGNQGCRFVDISEDMYETISDLVGPPSSVMLTSSFSSSSSSSSSGGGGGGDVTPEPSKRRSISTKVGTSNASSVHSIKSEPIDLISDDDSSSEDDEDDEEKERNEEESASVEAVPKSTQKHHGDDVDMEEKGNGSRSANATALAETTSADLQSGSADAEEDPNPDGDAADADFDNAGSVEHMDCDEELKEPAPAQRAVENGTEQHNEVKDSGTSAELASVEQNGSNKKRTASDVHNSEIEHDIESPRTSARKKQKLEHPDVAAMMNQLEQQTQHLNELVLQVQEERDREREEREKLLRAIKVDQHGREAVLELLRIEQEERRQDREERRNVLQILLRETQQRRKEFGGGDGVKSEDMVVKIKDENARL